jgi:outer membrane protein assembly factor BamA
LNLDIELPNKLRQTEISFGVAPFFDAGTVRDVWRNLNFKNIRYSYGLGSRIAWNQSTIISFDYEFQEKTNYSILPVAF